MKGDILSFKVVGEVDLCSLKGAVIAFDAWNINTCTKCGIEGLGVGLYTEDKNYDLCLVCFSCVELAVDQIEE